MKTSTEFNLISKALVLAQREIKFAVKDSKNPFFKSSYADLTSVIDAIKEPLNKAGIAFIQLVQSIESGDFVETILLHESGQFLSTETKVYCIKPNDPQAFGSGITYTKRYALQAIIGLPTEDDDANAATQKTKETVSKPKEKPVDLSPEQMEFCDKLRIGLEENLDGKQVDGPALRAYLLESAKLTGNPIPTDLKLMSRITTFILAKIKDKPELLTRLTGEKHA